MQVSLSAQVSMWLGGDVIDNRYFVGIVDEVRVWNVAARAPNWVVSGAPICP